MQKKTKLIRGRKKIAEELRCRQLTITLDAKVFNDLNKYMESFIVPLNKSAVINRFLMYYMNEHPEIFIKKYEAKPNL